MDPPCMFFLLCPLVPSAVLFNNIDELCMRLRCLIELSVSNNKLWLYKTLCGLFGNFFKVNSDYYIENTFLNNTLYMDQPLLTFEGEMVYHCYEPSAMVNKKRLFKYVLITLLCIIILCFIILFVIVPIVFMCSEGFQRLLMFTNIGLPSDRADFNRPIRGLTNFYLTFDDHGEEITLGVWHILPHKLINYTTSEDALANSNYSVIIHFHGSGETRMDSLNMFAVLYEYFHVIAFDYRGYGDSTDALLNEYAVARDSRQLYKWVRNQTNNDIYIWGHSLGAALSTLTLSDLHVNDKIAPAGLILEAPFTNMREEIPVHPYGKLFAWLPWFKQTILDPLDENGFKFNSSRNILNVVCPIMILHAEDDSVIPYTLGKKLAAIAADDRDKTYGNVTYHQFAAIFGYDHFRIYKAPELPGYISDFIELCDAYKNEAQRI